MWKYCQNNSENENLRTSFKKKKNTMVPAQKRKWPSSREFIRAIIPAITLSNQPENESFLFIADFILLRK
jgi:hypothetical protein